MFAIKDAAADYSGANAGRVLALTTDRAGLVGEFLFGRNQATSVFNSASDGAAGGVMHGTVAYDDHFLDDFGDAAWLDTGVGDAATLTVLVVSKPAANASFICYAGTGTAGGAQLALYRVGGGLTWQHCNASNVTTGLVVATGTPTAPDTDYRGLAGRTNGLVNPPMKVDEFKGGVRTQGASITGSATRVLDTRPILIGTIGAGVFSGGEADFAAALIWHRYLSDAELLAAYIEARATLALLGIPA